MLEASHARHQDTFSKVMDATLPRAAERDHDLGRSLEAALPHEPVEYTLTGAWDRLGAAWLVQRCTHAIRLGAPLYNAGAIYECTELYRTTIIECMRHPHNVPEAVQRIFYEVLGRHSLISASRRAWDFRSALDHAISIATAVCSPPQTRMVSPASIMHVPAVAPSDARDAHGWDPTSRIRARRRPHSSSSTAASSCSDASSPCNSRLISMPCDVLPLMLRHLCACELSALARTCTTLRGSSYAMAAEAVCASQPALRRGVRARTGRTGYVEIGATGGGGGAGAGSGTISGTISGTAPEPSWVRTLHAIETVETYVGPRPVGRSWWDEWPALRRAESSSTTAEAIDDAAFGRGGSHSIKVLLSQHAASLSWMVDAGWTPLHASITMLLLACTAAAIGRAIRNRSPAFAATVHALTDAMRQRARFVKSAAPPTYASIEGSFGLSEADPVWLELLHPGLALGHRFVTCAPLQAAIHPTRLPDPSHGGPVHRLVSAACEIRNGGPLVCFLSERGSAGDPLRTLLQTSPIGYALMPLATIELVVIHEPDTWHAGNGEPVPRRCFCVRVRVDY